MAHPSLFLAVLGLGSGIASVFFLANADDRSDAFSKVGGALFTLATGLLSVAAGIWR